MKRFGLSEDLKMFFECAKLLRTFKFQLYHDLLNSENLGITWNQLNYPKDNIFRYISREL